MIIFQNVVLNYTLNSLLLCFIYSTKEFELLYIDTDSIIYKFKDDIKLLEMKDGS